MLTFLFEVLIFLVVLAVVDFLGAACLLEECLTTKNNPKDNGYLIKCFAVTLQNASVAILSNQDDRYLIFKFSSKF
jgi:hypothetical protein